jgi:sterol desaturase/sphingolipid hydroxylase (fatty acid hydroxylase superfamily)
VSHEVVIRLGFFFGVLTVMALWELAGPRRRLTTSKSARWIANLAIVFIDTAVVRLVLPITAIGMALLAQERGWGLLNNVDLPEWAALVAGVLALDFVIYLQHVMFHAVPNLWRLHMMHHSDMDFDVTTGVRFHPIEIALSMVIKVAAVTIIGPTALAVLVFEVALNATSLFNHGNVRLPAAIDRVLRLFVVTPEMHRVHHSNIPRETNSNFGFNFPWWDRLLDTYRAQPAKGHEGMTIGLDQFRDPRRLKLVGLLVQPFVGQVSDYPINRRGRKEEDK